MRLGEIRGPIQAHITPRSEIVRPENDLEIGMLLRWVSNDSSKASLLDDIPNRTRIAVFRILLEVQTAVSGR
jgi:hypothetical protein